MNISDSSIDTWSSILLFQVRAAELLILNQLMQQSELDDEEEERQYEAIRDEVYADSNKF